MFEFQRIWPKLQHIVNQTHLLQKTSKIVFQRLSIEIRLHTFQAVLKISAPQHVPILEELVDGIFDESKRQMSLVRRRHRVSREQAVFR
jgi:hypothetical protein